MEYIVYKMAFDTGLHAGNTLLEDREMTIHADTLFSALCQQALKIGGETLLKEFFDRTERGEILLSDAFPYDDNHYYIAKPMISRSFAEENEAEEKGSSEKKKQDKKMKFIPIDAIESYISGKLDAAAVNEAVGNIGKAELRTQANIKDQEETLPYHVGIYRFNENCGLYVIIGLKNKESKSLTGRLFESLEFDGIGGKRSSGLGRFQLFSGRLDDTVLSKLDGTFSRYISLSVALPQQEELEDVLEGASCALLRRGGFVASETYAPEWRRKKDLYVFQAGSSFKRRFEGGIYDVSSGGGHPVYRYAKPVWLGVNI